MNAHDYHRQLVAQVDSVSAITSSNISFREIDEHECYVKAILIFASGHELHLAEYVVIRGEQAQRPQYRYQLLTVEKKSRWRDGTTHRITKSFPHFRFIGTLLPIKSAHRAKCPRRMP